ncbi:MAG: hypothetical protein EB023_00605 [Flavobacteriia bacterium]|nr:hypothetical protein [Flavobacteriia bacterium]
MKTLFHNFAFMNWLKFAQRILAIALIFIIWIAVFRGAIAVEFKPKPNSILIPKSTIGILHINSAALKKSLLFQFAFNNKDPKILKIVSEYWQNISQDTSKYKLPIDFSRDINILKVNYPNETLWILSGKYLAISHPLKPDLGFKKGESYFWILNSTRTNTKEICQQLLTEEWITHDKIGSSSLQFQLVSRGKVTNTYNMTLSQNKLTIQYDNTENIPSLVLPINKNFFHLTTSLNKGSFIPQKYAAYEKFISSISAFSMHYYGAKYIEDYNGPSYIEPNFDLLLTFSKRTNPTDILPLLKEVTDGDIQLENTYLMYNKTRYFIESITDSSIYIGVHRRNIKWSNGPFVMAGNPIVLTEISNLGWKQGVLELIPEYKALKDYSESIERISTASKGNKNTTTLYFKETLNAQMESFHLILTMANAYQF